MTLYDRDRMILESSTADTIKVCSRCGRLYITSLRCRCNRLRLTQTWPCGVRGGSSTRQRCDDEVEAE